MKQGRSFVDAAASVHLKHLVFSALEDTTVRSNPDTGVFVRSAAFMGKAAVSKYIAEIGLKSTLVKLSPFMEGIESSIVVKDNRHVIENSMIAQDSIHLISIADAGEAIARLILDSSFQGNLREIGLSADFLNWNQIAELMSKKLGYEVVHSHSNSNANDALTDIYSYYALMRIDDRDIERTRALVPNLKRFQQFLELQ